MFCCRFQTLCLEIQAKSANGSFLKISILLLTCTIRTSPNAKRVISRCQRPAFFRWHFIQADLRQAMKRMQFGRNGLNRSQIARIESGEKSEPRNARLHFVLLSI